ncbi:flagellar basal-body rod modification protein FlgD [Hydrogenimonas sp.]|nr:flagellar basal-body rod modification protein FlgD [Hydrogenimonas sp.]
MDVTTTTSTITTTGTTDQVYNPDGVLGKDDFLQLLITELQYQDPTDPMDSDKILSQTSQLATLEAQTNTNETMKQISEAYMSTSQFNTIGAIGKIADVGNSDIRLDESGSTYFEIYFPEDAASGTLQITDSSGNIIKSVDLPSISSGVHPFEWDGTDSSGNRVDAGVYQVNVSYNTPDGEELTTRVGLYPIESVRFEEGEALLKLGSSYIPMQQVKEVYGE